MSKTGTPSPPQAAHRGISLLLCFLYLLGLGLGLAPVALCAAEKPPVMDLEHFPQKASAYLPVLPDEPIADYATQRVYADEYLQRHYAPWLWENLSYLDLSFDKIVDYHRATANRQLFSADGKQFPKEELRRIRENGLLEDRPTSRPAIALAEADVRVLPTATPLYPSRNSARGERGLLKQDVLQNSALKPGEPLAVYGTSKDAKWLFIASGTVVGWVPTGKVASVDDEFIESYVYSDHAVIVRDNVPFHDAKGVKLCTAKLGTILPRDGADVLLPVRGKNGMATTMRHRSESGVAPRFPIPFTPRNAADAIDRMMGERYGWGGLDGLRDCSAMTRDYFTLFGVWLPRNSGDQAKTGASIPLRNIPVETRPKTIVENGVPFATMIHMPGHIMLYLGVYDSQPIVFHNVWGVRTILPGGKVGRTVIGRAAVTSLRAGAEIRNRPESSLYIDNIAALVYPMADIR